MTKYIYLVESKTEKSNFGFKAFSSYKAAKKFTKNLPELKHTITQIELLNLNSF